MKNFVYALKDVGDFDEKEIGQKVKRLANSYKLGINLADGFAVTSQAVKSFFKNKKVFADDIKQQITGQINVLEKNRLKRFGDIANPIVFAVSPSSFQLLPDLLPNVLNIGINDKIAETLAAKYGEYFAFNSYCNLITTLCVATENCNRSIFDAQVKKALSRKKIDNIDELTGEDMKKLSNEFKSIYKRVTKKEFEQDVTKQLFMAIEAICLAWEWPAAIDFRRRMGYRHEADFGILIQEQRFGNMGPTSGSGIVYSRNPQTGEKKIFGHYAMNTQGDNFLSGIKKSIDINELSKQSPSVYSSLIEICQKLEAQFCDMQSVQFVIENGDIHVIEILHGARNAVAMLRIAVDLIKEKKLDEAKALCTIKSWAMQSLLSDVFDKKSLEKAKKIGSGIPAGLGVGSGVIAFSAKSALEMIENGKKPILVLQKTRADMIDAMIAAEGILCEFGDIRSHASAVSQLFCKPCITGCDDLKILVDEDDDEEEFTYCKIGGRTYKEGDKISIDGGSGRVFEGYIDQVSAKPIGDYDTILKIADKFGVMCICSEVNDNEQIEKATKLGAKEILFADNSKIFSGKQINALMQEFVLATKDDVRIRVINKLEPLITENYKKIFGEVVDKTLHIKLFDLSLQNFLPYDIDGIKALAKDLKGTEPKMRVAVEQAREKNPMFGLRGARFLLVREDFLKMQIKAIANAIQKDKNKIFIYVPFVLAASELIYTKEIIKALEPSFFVGSIVENTRACFVDWLSLHSDSVLFDFSSLSANVCGISEADKDSFVDLYYAKKFLKQDIFCKLDETGVGQVICIAFAKIKASNPNCAIGLFGEHANDHGTVEFCNKLGFSHLFCRPTSVPKQRVFTAKAQIRK